MDTSPQTSHEIRAFLEASIIEERVKSELGAFDFRILYVHPATKAPFIEFWPR